MKILVPLCLLCLSAACAMVEKFSIPDGEHKPPPPAIFVTGVTTSDSGQTIEISFQASFLMASGSLVKGLGSYVRVKQADTDWSPKHDFKGGELSDLKTDGHTLTVTVNTTTGTTVGEPITIHYSLIYFDGVKNHTIDTTVFWTS